MKLTELRKIIKEEVRTFRRMQKIAGLLKENMDPSQTIFSVNAIGIAEGEGNQSKTKYEQIIYVAVNSPREARTLAEQELNMLYDKYSIRSIKKLGVYNDLDSTEQEIFQDKVAVFDPDVLYTP